MKLFLEGLDKARFEEESGFTVADSKPDRKSIYREAARHRSNPLSDGTSPHRPRWGAFEMRSAQLAGLLCSSSFPPTCALAIQEDNTVLDGETLWKDFIAQQAGRYGSKD